ncbi:phosphatidylinositol alpha-1,6-mannosyltransferase [Actinopolymorpha cephalotaxi]|uniref:Glycosyltransferase involved in cell wall biosynthesis n=1 Tax=Actinopolymorpha cephalotaxi TaxID=504797 RepID=A0A1I2U981_9ACTN|nr:glycosyltransferase family 4 protein [Actinopolymorpha cephalotaxi]NYH86470.1 glycosyltransferase involved in cell wall biosynthesis [Actinopolymorpha cephalotaxi]SFG72959.1 phosphatidylinositol alpha-1,6-mannosyltransferase [Actinopolymorpha cephalotaxi]
MANRVDALERLGHDVEVVAVRDHPSATVRYAGLLTAVARAARADRTGRTVLADRTGRTDRVEAAEPGTVVEAHIAHPSGAFAWPLAARLRAPLVLFAHGSDVLRLPGRSWVDARLCRFVFERADLVVANSRYLAGEVARRFHRPAERTAVVSPGIRYADLAAARVASETGSETGAGGRGSRPYELLFVGNLVHRKGLDVLLAALADLDRRGVPVPRLRVVGAGPELPKLRRQADAARLRVDFAGALPQRAVVGELARAELLAVPSREEALGLAPLEGMAAGSVPVASAVGGLAESVTDGVTGFTCPAEDPSALASALVRARDAVRDPARRAALVAAGDAVARTHSVDAAAAATIERYAGLLATSSPLAAGARS